MTKTLSITILIFGLAGFFFIFFHIAKASHVIYNECGNVCARKGNSGVCPEAPDGYTGEACSQEGCCDDGSGCGVNWIYCEDHPEAIHYIRKWGCPGCESSRPRPSCEIDVSRITIYGLNESYFMQPSLSSSNGDISSVEYTVNDPNIAEVLPPNPNTQPPFGVTFESIAVGETTYKAKAYVDGESCEDSDVLQVINPLPWWQVRGGDVVAGGGNLVSQIPAECSLDPAGSCSSYLILDNPNGSPGVPSAGGQIFLNSREPSLQGWKIFEDQYRGSQINYSFFENKIPTDAPITGIIRDTIDANYFTNGGITYKGYYLYQFQGNDSVGKTLEITGSFANLGSRRVILFVKNADLVINTRINVQRGVGGFYAFVEGNPESSNGITIGSDVGDVLPRDPEDFDLEGLFYTDKNFTTESRGQNSDYQLRIRGIVSARNFNLQRHLPNNAFYPAEFFEFAPDILLNYPPFLTAKNITWKEVNP